MLRAIAHHEQGETGMFRNILIPTDGSPLSGRALDNALNFAHEIGARATILTVMEPFHIFSADTDQLELTRAEYKTHINLVAENILSRAGQEAKTRGVDHITLKLENDDPHLAIIQIAHSQNCDLIAMASHGRRGLSAVLLGSVTSKVLTHSHIPVLVYR
ncbi:universal stress protein [Bosea thiooxidans]